MIVKKMVALKMINTPEGQVQTKEIIENIQLICIRSLKIFVTYDSLKLDILKSTEHNYIKHERLQLYAYIKIQFRYKTQPDGPPTH